MGTLGRKGWAPLPHADPRIAVYDAGEGIGVTVVGPGPS